MLYEFIWGSEGVLGAIIPLLVIGGLAVAAGGALGSHLTQKEKDRQLGKMRSAVDKEHGDNNAWYNASALSDYTQRADAQNMLKNLRDNLSASRRQTTATAAVTGATPAAVAAEKERATRAVSDTYANLAAQGQRWKDNIGQEYRRRKDYLNTRYDTFNAQKLADLDNSRASWSNLTSTGLNVAAGGLGGGSGFGALGGLLGGGQGGAGQASNNGGGQSAASAAAGSYFAPAGSYTNNYNGRPAGSYGMYKTWY